MNTKNEGNNLDIVPALSETGFVRLTQDLKLTDHEIRKHREKIVEIHEYLRLGGENKHEAISLGKGLTFMYYSTFIPDKSNGQKVNGFSNPVNHTPFQYLAAIHNWEAQNRAYKRKVLDNIKKKDFDGLPLEEVGCYSLVLGVSLGNVDIATAPKVLIEKFLSGAHLNVLCPNYLLTLPEVAQALFFLFYFKALRNDDKLNDPNSDIWKYLLQRFKNIKVVRERYRGLVDRRKKVENTQSDTSKRVEQTVKSTSIRKLLVGEDLPTQNEIDFILSLYSENSRPPAVSIRKIINTLLQERLKFGGKRSYSENIAYFLSGMKVEVAPQVLRGKVRGSILDAVISWGGLTKENRISFLESVNKAKLEGAKFYAYEATLISLLASHAIHEFGSGAAMDDLIRTSHVLLLYPPFFKSYQQKYVEEYFTCIFESGYFSQELSNMNSDFWEYLLKYFGYVEVIQNKYKELISSNKDRLNVVSERLESQKDILEESLKPRVADILIEKEEEMLYFDVPTNWEEGMSLHVVLYKKTRSGQNLNPQFYCFGKEDSCGIPNMTENRYSYIAFWDRREVALKKRSEIPIEIGNVQPKNVINKALPEDTRKLATKRVGDKTDKLARPRINSKDIKGIDLPDYETLEAFMSLVTDPIGDEIGKQLHFRDVVTQEFLNENWLAGVTSSRDIIFDISGETAILVSVFGIPCKKHTFDPEALSHFEQAANNVIEKNKQISNKQKLAEIRQVIESIDLPEKYESTLMLQTILGKNNEIDKLANGEEIEYWKKPRGEAVKSEIINDFKALGYEVSFSIGKRGITEAIQVEKVDQNNSDEIELEECEYIRKVIQAYLFSLNFTANKKNKAKTDLARARINERRDIKQATIKRLENGEGTYWKDNNEYKGEQVALDDPEIDDYPILGRRGSISFGGRKQNKDRFDANYEFLKEYIFSEEGEYFLLYFWGRLRAGDFRSDSVKKIISSFDREIDLISDNINDIKDICRKVLYKLQDNAIPVTFIETLTFSSFELKRSKS